MMMAHFQAVAALLISHILNSLPAGIVLAALVWIMVRLLPRQNSGTRFAIWFVALGAIVAFPFVSGIEGSRSVPVLNPAAHPLITLPEGWASGLLAIWLIVSGVALLRLVVGLWRVRGLRDTSAAIDTAGLDPALAKAVSEFAAAKSVSLRTSETFNVPAAVGFRKPAILLPQWALRELTAEQLNVILLHEYAHVRRRDSWTNLLQKFVRAIFCFHPAVWWIENRLSLEREMACDDYVLGETSDPRGYATCLLTLLERNCAPRAWAMAQAAVYRAREATLRLSQILDANRSRSRQVWKPALGVVSAFSLACLVVLPQLHQLVGFAPESRATYTDVAAAPIVPGHSMVTGKVVPASMHFHASRPEGEHSNSGVKHHAKTSGSRVPQNVSRTLVASTQKQLNAPAALLSVAQGSAEGHDVVPVKAEGTVIPVTRTVLVIRTTDQIGPDTWQWSIRVWQLTIVPQNAQRVAIASKT